MPIESATMTNAAAEGQSELGAQPCGPYGSGAKQRENQWNRAAGGASTGESNDSHYSFHSC
jgi:hypothetical protein